jgi:hypothetical protein
MTVHLINGCKIDLATMSDNELFLLAEQIGRNMDQMQRALEEVCQELNRRSLNKSFDPPLLPAS